MKTLDAAAPFVLTTKPLGRRAGAMVRVERSVPAPAGWAVATCAVPEASPVELDLRLESVVEGVLVSGTAEVAEQAECSRCLEPVELSATIDLQQLYVYDDEPVGGPDEEEPLPVLDGELLDLEPVVRDAVVLELPLAPLCRPDCPGLCQECGVRLADEPGHAHDQVDPRWGGLAGWRTEPADSGAGLTATTDLHDPREGR
jgi:uncharacterized protein